MFIQLHQVVKDQHDRAILVNVTAIAYVESDTPEEWATVHFNAITATSPRYTGESDEIYTHNVSVREDYATISARILAAVNRPLWQQHGEMK